MFIVDSKKFILNQRYRSTLITILESIRYQQQTLTEPF